MCSEQFQGIDKTEFKLPVDEIGSQGSGFELFLAAGIFCLSVVIINIQAFYSLGEVVEELLPAGTVTIND